jgi:hypothetical protein
MENINTAEDLQKAILEREKERWIQERDLKQQWDVVTESFKPVNILRRTFHDIFSRVPRKPDLIGSAVAFGAGLVTKKVIEGKSPGTLRKTAGNAMQWGVTSLVAKNSHTLWSAGSSLFKKIFPRKIKKTG